MADGRKCSLSTKSGLVRLGRHEDNDLQLLEASVHRHHAIIHRTADGTYFITDLSGSNGNGVTVNGVRHAQVELQTGDRIELGSECIKFDCAPA
jgi:pSer/pThr/pTyr-binding forkhead associated (FHA) protein